MDTLSYKTISANSQTVTKSWFVINAEDQTLGRLSTRIAVILRGKHKPSYTPHVDCGDNVIVINAAKVRLNGNKWETKQYIRFSGYPSGQKRRTAKEQLEKNPISLVEKAVKGMLPKNRLGRAIYKNLFVYEGTDHPHEAQKPQEIKIN